MREFPSTSWSLILAATDQCGVESGEALASLCGAYWYPLYAYARRNSYSPEAARDCTQGYFTKLLEKEYLRDARPERGKFRSFLLTSFKHYLANELDRERAAKRGGHATILSLELERAEDRYASEPRDNLSPDKLFERRWATTLLDRALSQLSSEFTAAGKSHQFARMSVFLTGEPDVGSYAKTAAELGTTEGAFKVAVHRLRKRLKELVRAEIAQTVQRPEDIDDEVRFLFRALGY